MHQTLECARQMPVDTESASFPSAIELFEPPHSEGFEPSIWLASSDGITKDNRYQHEP
jgi:hypothetical protein